MAAIPILSFPLFSAKTRDQTEPKSKTPAKYGNSFPSYRNNDNTAKPNNFM